ncbi:MAG: nuclear transport factor 2 family protein [Stellaceae bacterium]
MSAKTMRSITASFAQSDLRPLLDALHPDIVWKSATDELSPLRFGGTHTGRAGVTKVLATIAADYQFRRFQPVEIVESGEIVWGVFDAVIDHTPTARKHPNPKPIAFQCAIRWRFRDGMIAEHQAFFDTGGIERAASDSSSSSNGA